MTARSSTSRQSHIDTVATLIDLLCQHTASVDQIVDRASVVDGDTLEIHGTRVRLWGIDAPESSRLCRCEDGLQYRCAAKAANDLDAFLGSQTVTCNPGQSRPIGAPRGGVFSEGPRHRRWMVAQGLALDWPQYSQGEYGRAEAVAKRAQRGIWAGSFAPPWQYRACLRAKGPP
jgi:endonuclease YncB( thermonuclease family)